MNNPQVNRFVNESLRVVMTDLIEAYDRARAMVETYDATGLDAVLPDDATVIVDGRASSGVPNITAQGVKVSVANTRALIQQLAAPGQGGMPSMIDGARSISPRYA